MAETYSITPSKKGTSLNHVVDVILTRYPSLSSSGSPMTIVRGRSTMLGIGEPKVLEILIKLDEEMSEDQVRQIESVIEFLQDSDLATYIKLRKMNHEEKRKF